MSQLSRYTLLQRLGGSVLGSLYRAQDTTTGSVVTLRVLQLGLLDDASSGQLDARLCRDVGAASRLLHPGIARVFEIRREGRTALIASELVEGPTITSYVAAPSGSDLSKVVTAAIQLLDALEFAHAQSVIHRNLKPANVRVQGTRVCITDFGIADLASGDDADAGATLDNTEYMAPEQFLNGAVDHRCDVHAAGAIIYEMLTGKSPFAGDANRLTAMSKVLELVPPPPSQVRVGLPPIFDRVLARALAKSSAQRFASARQFRDELSAAYAALMRPPTTVIQPKTARSIPVHKPVAADRPCTVQTAPLEGFDLDSTPASASSPAPAAEMLAGNTLPGSRTAVQAADAAKPPEVAQPRAAPTGAIRLGGAPAREPAKEVPLSGGTILVKPKPVAAGLAASAPQDLVRDSVPIEEVLANASRGNAAHRKDPAPGPLPGGTVLARAKPAAVDVATVGAEALVSQAVPIDAVLAQDSRPLATASPATGGTELAKPKPAAVVAGAPDAKQSQSPSERPRIKEDDTIWISGKHDVSELLAAMPVGSAAAPAAAAPATASPAAAPGAAAVPESAAVAVEPPAPAAVELRAPARGVPPAPKPLVPLTEATVAHGARVLARFVGPIATVFSRRAAQQAQDERGYFGLLAGHLTDASERNRFLREVRKR